MLTQEHTVLIEKHVRHFLLYEQIYEPTNVLIRKYVNKYCKTGVPERTLLRTGFVKACMHVSYLTRTILLMLHVREKCK